MSRSSAALCQVDPDRQRVAQVERACERGIEIEQRPIDGATPGGSGVVRPSARRDDESGLRLVAQMLCDSAGIADEDRYGRADRFQRHEPEPLMAGGHHQQAGSSQVCLEQLLVSGVVPDQDVESVIGQLDQLVSQCSGFGRRRASDHERRRAPVVEWPVVERPERRAARSSPLRYRSSVRPSTRTCRSSGMSEGRSRMPSPGRIPMTSGAAWIPRNMVAAFRAEAVRLRRRAMPSVPVAARSSRGLPQPSRWAPALGS